MSRALPLLLSVVLAGCGLLSRTVPAEQQRSEAALATVFAVAAAPEAGPAELAPLVVANGGDAARRWRAPADTARPAEIASVRELAGTIQATLADVSRGGQFSYRVEEFVLEPGDEGPWHVLRARFEDPGQTEFEASFLPVDGRLLLGRFER